MGGEGARAYAASYYSIPDGLKSLGPLRLCTGNAAVLILAAFTITADPEPPLPISRYHHHSKPIGDVNGERSRQFFGLGGRKTLFLFFLGRFVNSAKDTLINFFKFTVLQNP